MAIPDQIPEAYEATNEQKQIEHLRAHKRVRQELYLATERLIIFLENTPTENIFRKVHAATTKITNAHGDVDTVRYFSLWTTDDMRLTTSGLLLRSDDYPKKYHDMHNGADKSHIISDSDLRKFTSGQLVTVATHLEKFLNPNTH